MQIQQLFSYSVSFPQQNLKKKFELEMYRFAFQFFLSLDPDNIDNIVTYFH